MVRERLRANVQGNQTDLFRLQNQLSTGRRLFSPSDDAPSALRAINLQRTIERKTQLQTNLRSAEQGLTKASSSLTEVSNVLNDLRAATLGVVGTDSSQDDRDAVIAQIDQALFTLLEIGSSKHLEQFLFSGTRSLDKPYEAAAQYVEYHGNESTLRSRVDTDLLFGVGLPGNEVFGGLSEAVRGTSDLEPRVTPQTRIVDINGGAGISPDGSIEIVYNPSVGGATQRAVIDLSKAHTLADVARLIETGAPTGAALVVEVAGGGFRVTAGDGAVAINEAAGGRAAEQLGLLSPIPSGQVVGGDLDPLLRNTTRLDDLLGSKAQGRLQLPGVRNDLTIRAASSGADFNNLTVEIVGTGTVGAESASYNASTNTLTVQIQPGATSAASLAAAINAEGTFVAAPDPRDAATAGTAGSGVAVVGTYAGATDTSGSGAPFDKASGLVIANGGAPFTVDTSTAETVEDLLNLLNRPETGLAAAINAEGTGIDVRTRRSGANLTIGENGGQTAGQLGIQTFHEGVKLAELNRGVGVTTRAGDDLEIELSDGATTTAFTVDLSAALTVQDALDAINTATGGAVTARLAAVGGGIELVDSSTLTPPVTLTVRSVSGSQAAIDLGLIATGQTEASVTSALPGAASLKGEDRASVEVDSVFNTLYRLREALQKDDNAPAVSAAVERLDDDLTRVTFARAEAGARLQNLDSVGTRLGEEDIQLRAALSIEIDVDFAQAVSDFQAKQFALQASLQTSASLLQLSILNFI
ncbi:Flagellar hook-associated protein 3 [Pirellulimonas nuda]|uniref:Flagellar hook-associated protein 3 n=1 Tax=Pirellulimonas nuda TaxID=2528009 RepID=A0A518DFR9_9BACT|nr:flagellin [Pirellulimonas nuda]QDU90314.1 Flagellar hook-associated protein 3 [Pirellulimonas nuda]